MKPELQKPQLQKVQLQKPLRFRPKPESHVTSESRVISEPGANLDSRLAAHFAKLKQPSADFDQRLFDKIRAHMQAMPCDSTTRCH